jgi:hypothetical protein
VTLYHVTSIFRLAAIQREGLRPDAEPTHWAEPQGKIWLTADKPFPDYADEPGAVTLAVELPDELAGEVRDGVLLCPVPIAPDRLKVARVVSPVTGGGE